MMNAVRLVYRLYRAAANLRSPRQRFTRIYNQRAFGAGPSLSGPGSDLAQTETLRRTLPELLKKHAIRSMLDIPCGDWNWMRHVDLGTIDYTGADVVVALIRTNQQSYTQPGREFRIMDLCRDPLPRTDLILCRDCLVHLSWRECRRALRNIRSSGSQYLLATTFPKTTINRSLQGIWRPLNLQAEPFCFPAPLELLNEGCTEMEGIYADKSLGLWKIEDIG